ncbi:hypothetical protein [Longispora fulva]|uniref:Uncharacterized protein n=1 Tax=Longispora fulva TaxID=619741 RepID=A0A8J7G9K1_9ACTN|nr:hypothetical protein [Longispora fulva]MBG6136278.1 hypothetical protein [Longispora fulva]
MVEADPAGGDLAARFGHSMTPGLVTLAAANRSGAAGADVGEHAQRLADLGVDVVLAPPDPSAEAGVRALVSTSGGELVVGGAARAVVCDVGRLAETSAAMPLVRHADRVLVVVRPWVEDQAHLQARLWWLRQAAGDRLGLVLAGTGPYSAADISRAWGVTVLGQVPFDDGGAGVLAGRLATRRWHLRPVARALGDLADVVVRTTPVPTRERAA